MPLEKLTELARGRLNGCLVHFGSCWTALDDNQLYDFLETTGAAVVTGYTKSVDWIDSASMDLLILDWAKEYSNAKSLIDKIADTYSGLQQETGFVAYQL